MPQSRMTPFSGPGNFYSLPASLNNFSIVGIQVKAAGQNLSGTFCVQCTNDVPTADAEWFEVEGSDRAFSGDHAVFWNLRGMGAAHIRVRLVNATGSGQFETKFHTKGAR